MNASFENNLRYLLARDGDVAPSDPSDLSISDAQRLAQKHGYHLDDLLLYNLEADQLHWDDIRFIFLDVDGVMTEGGMFYTESGDEFKRFDTKDGMAIKMAMKNGLSFGIISSGVNKAIIQHRADMFGIQNVYVGTDPKIDVATRWIEEMNLEWSNCGYIGDDVNDLQMFEKVGISGCPSDATIPIKRAADFVLTSRGGHGCVREYVRYLPSMKTIL